MRQEPQDNFTIRVARHDDATELKDLFTDTVLTVNRRDYSEAEVEDWASCGDNPSKWEGKIDAQYFIVAVNRQGRIAGFSSITPEGYLDFMYIHKDFQCQGIATMLLEEIERHAEENKIIRITSEVSLTARPFFERKGYRVETVQKRKANQLYLTNFVMAKGI